MPQWTVDTPTTLDFDQVTALRVRAISGSVAVLSTDERACLDIDSISGQPLLVSHSGGVLTVSYEDLTWGGLLGWLRPSGTRRRSPSPCPRTARSSSAWSTRSRSCPGSAPPRR